MSTNRTVSAICIKADFPDPKPLATEVVSLLRRNSAQLHGHLREAGGSKAWVRELMPVLHAAQDLANWLESPSGAVTRASLQQELQDVLPDVLWTPAAHHAGRSLGELLPGLLRRFAGGSRPNWPEPRRRRVDPPSPSR